MYHKEESVYDGGLNLGFLYSVITGILGLSYDVFAICFSVPSEYVHNYDVSAMMCFKIGCSVPGRYVYFSVPDRYLYYKKGSVNDGG